MGRLTIDSGTIFYDFPTGFDIVRESTVTSVRGERIAGRMGVYVRSYGNPIGQKEITLFGRLYGTDAVDLDDKTEVLMRVFTFGTAMTLTDNTLSRHAEVWLSGIRYTDRLHAFIREVTIRLIVPLGVWGLDRNFAHSVTTASINSTKLIRYAHPQYAGSVPGPAQLILTPSSSTWPASGNGEVIWKGRNLVVNSSVEEGVGATPDDWTAPAGSSDPDVIEHLGRTGGRCLRVHRTGGGTHHNLGQTIPCDASTQYVFSAYVARVSAGATARIVIQSLDAALGFLSNSTGDTVVTGTSWQRASRAHTSHASAAFLAVTIRVVNNSEEIYADDFQLERGSVAGEFINTSEPRYKHVSFKLESPAQLTNATADSLAIDNVRARTRLLRSGSWQENNDEVNGHYFELVPGLNHIEFSPPTAGNLDVEIRHKDLYL